MALNFNMAVMVRRLSCGVNAARMDSLETSGCEELSVPREIYYVPPTPLGDSGHSPQTASISFRSLSLVLCSDDHHSYVLC